MNLGLLEVIIQKVYSCFCRLEHISSNNSSSLAIEECSRKLSQGAIEKVFKNSKQSAYFIAE